MPVIQFTYQLDFNGEIVSYLVSPKHRENNNPHKSVWIVSPDDEFGCFKVTYEKEWVENNDAWGFLLDDNNKLIVIGIGINDEELKIARFKKNHNAEEWHGYPCNYLVNSHDVPSETVMRKWVTAKIITKAKMSKIQRSLSCNL